MPPGTTIAFQAVSPTGMKYVIKVNGEPATIGVPTVAAGGQLLADVPWTPGKESEKQTAMYLKQ